MDCVKACLSEALHIAGRTTTVETSAHTDNDVLEVLKLTDAVFMDVKHMDSAAHRKQ